MPFGNSEYSNPAELTAARYPAPHNPPVGAEIAAAAPPLCNAIGRLRAELAALRRE